LITGLWFISRRLALTCLQYVLHQLGAESDLFAVAQRKIALRPHPPPGMAIVVDTIPGRRAMTDEAAAT